VETAQRGVADVAGGPVAQPPETRQSTAAV